MAFIQPEVLKGFNLFQDGVGYAGLIEVLPLPVLEFENEEYQSGGMNAPIDVEQSLKPIRIQGIEIAEPSPAFMKAMGVATVDGLRLRAQGSYKSVTQTTEKKLTAWFRGKWTKQEHEKWESTKPGKLTLDASLAYYKLQYGTEVIHEIDILNSIEIINGVDRWAARRANLGI